MGLTITEENYLKAIWKLSAYTHKAVTTNAIAAHLTTTAASVTDMLKRLAEKNWVTYEKYKGVALTDEGRHSAVSLVRRHRLWEVFLAEKLGFGWHEVHDIAEELEHIASAKLVERLDAYLGYPTTDPHGDPIPDADGVFAAVEHLLLSAAAPQKTVVMVGVNEHSPTFLQYLDAQKLAIGTRLIVTEIIAYDHSLQLALPNGDALTVSAKVAQNIWVKMA